MGATPRESPITVRTPVGAAALVRDFRRWAGARATAMLGIAFAAALLEGAGLLLLLPVLHFAFGENAAAWLAEGVAWRLALPLAAFLAVVALRSRAMTARDVGLARLQHGYVEALRARVLARLVAAPWSTASRISQAELVRVLEIELPRIGLAVNFALNGAVAALLLLVATSVALAIAPPAALVGLLFAALAGVVGLLHLRNAQRAGEAIAATSLAPADRALRLLDGLKVASAQDERPAFRAEVERAGAKAAAARIGVIAVQTAARNHVTTVSALAGVAVLVLGATVFRLPPATLSVLIIVLSRMAGPATLVQQAGLQLVQSAPSYAEFQRFVQALPPPGEGLEEAAASAPDASDRPPPQIIAREVRYRHPGTGAGIDGLTLSIASGTLLGVEGASGSGKTTFVDLLAGLLAPQQGQILIDGRALDADARRRFQARLAYAGAEPVLCADTVRNNLVWGEAQRDDAAIWRALRVAGAEPLVRMLPGGLDTELAARGAQLSAGERQRLALARAVLRIPALLILDEATASLDIRSEAAILAALRDLAPSPTVILVSHRAESLAACDRVVTFEQGRLIRGRDRSPAPRAITLTDPHEGVIRCSQPA